MEVQGTEMQNQEAVQPERTETQTGEAVQPQPHELADTEFDEYIEKLKSGETPDAPKNEIQTEAEHESAEKPEENKAYRTFETQEEFQRFMDDTISKRLRNHKETEKRYSDLERRAKSIYGGENALEQLLENAQRQAAEESGKSEEEFAELLSLRRDAEKLREMEQRQKNVEQAIEEKQKEWLSDSEKLREVIPDFDFDKAMENDGFRDNILKGMSVAASYISMTKNPPKTEERKPVFEVGAGSGKTGSMGAINPLNMSDKDFSDYIERIKNGG